MKSGKMCAVAACLFCLTMFLSGCAVLPVKPAFQEREIPIKREWKNDAPRSFFLEYLKPAVSELKTQEMLKEAWKRRYTEHEEKMPEIDLTRDTALLFEGRGGNTVDYRYRIESLKKCGQNLAVRAVCVIGPKSAYQFVPWAVSCHIVVIEGKYDLTTMETQAYKTQDSDEYDRLTKDAPPVRTNVKILYEWRGMASQFEDPFFVLPVVERTIIHATYEWRCAWTGGGDDFNWDDYNNPPDVDFEKSMVLCAGVNASSATRLDVRFTRIVEKEDCILAYVEAPVEESANNPERQNAWMRGYFHYVEIERSDKPVFFVISKIPVGPKAHQ